MGCILYCWVLKVLNVLLYLYLYIMYLYLWFTSIFSYVIFHFLVGSLKHKYLGLLTYNSSVACAIGTHPKVAKILFVSQQFYGFYTLVCHRILSCFCAWYEGSNFILTIFQLFGTICWKDGFSGVRGGQLLILKGVVSGFCSCNIWSVSYL